VDERWYNKRQGDRTLSYLYHGHTVRLPFEEMCKRVRMLQEGRLELAALDERRGRLGSPMQKRLVDFKLSGRQGDH
jgi:hypothetical protein